MTTTYQYAKQAQRDAETFAMSMRAEMPHCVNDDERTMVAEMVGLAEGAAKLLSRTLSSYDEYITTSQRAG